MGRKVRPGRHSSQRTSGSVSHDPEELVASLKNNSADIVMVDVQGSMNKTLIAAIVASDITIVPAKANVMEMAETVKLFEWAQSSLKRAPLRLVLTRVEGIDLNTTAFKDAIQLIRQNNLPSLQNVCARPQSLRAILQQRRHALIDCQRPF